MEVIKTRDRANSSCLDSIKSHHGAVVERRERRVSVYQTNREAMIISSATESNFRSKVQSVEKIEEKCSKSLTERL